MLITNNYANTNQFNSLIQLILAITASLLIFTQAGANELNAEQYSVSQGSLKIELNDEQRKKIIEMNKLLNTPVQPNNKATYQTREAILASRKNSIEKSNKSLLTKSHLNGYYADFAIYGAYSLLQDDYDGDGFYQTFSVVFDADIYSYTDNQLGEVYALLYISKNGGPWTHYFTTETFIIEGDTDLDEYEVITTFLSGYSSDYYDVLIDLYEVSNSDIVATYSSDDSNALYALSLESADYDEPYFEVVEVRGGSIYWLILILLSIYLLRVKIQHTNLV